MYTDATSTCMLLYICACEGQHVVGVRLKYQLSAIKGKFDILYGRSKKINYILLVYLRIDVRDFSDKYNKNPCKLYNAYRNISNTHILILSPSSKQF